MIAFLKGKLVEKNPTYAIIDCNGVGYFLNISLQTFSQLPDHEAVKLHTHLVIKEDSHTLYGFTTVLEREMFRLLISVSGVGPSTARTMLSSLTTEEVQQAIAGGDVATVQSVKGIGAKTAQKVIIELKDKVVKLYGLTEIDTPTSNTQKDEALSALEVLGFNVKQADKVLTSLLKQDPSLDVESLIKQALKSL